MSKKFAILSTLMLASISAFSQQEKVQEKILDPVIVTANKTEQKQSTTGKVITVITKEQIEKSAGKSVAQILNEQAGITINGALNNLGSVQTTFMRGASSGRTLILIDGIPVNDPTMINNEFDLNLISLNNVEQIEICKGAQSTLYGSDAIGGVINIITTKKDISKPLNAKATASFGNYGTFKGNAQLYGKIDKLSYTARYAKLSSTGFSAAYDSTGKNNFDNDGYNGDNVAASLQYQASKAFAVKTFVQYSQYKTDLDASAFTDEKNYFAKDKGLFTGAGFTYKKNDFSLTGNYQYSNNKRYFDDNFSTGATTYSTNTYNGASNYFELYTSFKVVKNITALVGSDFRTATMNGQYFSSSWGASPYKDTSLHQYSAYASLIYTAFKNRMHIELGGRYNHHSRYGTNDTYTFNPSYNFTEHWKIMGSIATGFKSPSIYQLYDTYSGNEDLKPEKSTNYEAGFQFIDKKINVRTVFFYRTIDNGIDYNYISYKYYNYIAQKVTGIEFEATVHPIQQLNIGANYTYMAGQETSQNRVTNQDTITYKYLLRRPKNSINISVGYQIIPQLYISISSKYVSSRYDVGGYMVPDVNLASYILLNAYAEYKLSKYTKLFVDAQNITNKKFFDVYGYNSIPFLINGGITFNF